LVPAPDLTFTPSEGVTVPVALLAVEADDELLDDELPDDELPDDELLDDELLDDELLEDELPDDELLEDELPDDEEMVPLTLKKSDLAYPVLPP
jgi:hypothetical protein